MINCRRATELISQRQERPLTLRETISLKFHLLICHLCRGFAAAVGFLSTQAEQYTAQDVEAAETLSDAAKERIGRAMANES